MTDTFLVTYVDADGTAVHKLVDEKHFKSENRPSFEIDGIPLFSITTIQPYL